MLFFALTAVSCGMLDAKDTQFRLAEDGVISFQEQESNPLPGVAVARLAKGEHVLRPAITIEDAKGVDETALQTRLNDWFTAHVKNVLELLAALEEPNEFKESTKEIITRVHAAMGIVPREELEDVIEKLDADDRKDLRAKRIRLGPILVFIPALNKPAAVRLRALLWSVYHGGALPAQVPNDGIVSCSVENPDALKDLYQSIGYPIFGPRAARIDMLDRVICAVYDSAEKGKFQAQHQMAEWLGCPIEDLYQILEAMGHVRISESQGSEFQKEEAAKPDVKPELAWFYLKRGKAFEKGSAGKKPAFKKPHNENKKQDFKKDQKKKGKRNKSTNRAPKVMSAEAKIDPADNPFAVLEQLKK